METKIDLTEETLTALQELYTTNQGSMGFYQEAAKQASDPVFRDLFASLAEQRAATGAVLAIHMYNNEEQPKGGGSIADALHETWLKMRGLLNSGDHRVLLIEAERAEDRIKARYERLLKKTAGSAMNAVLQEQYATVKQAHDRIRDLRDAANRAT